MLRVKTLALDFQVSGEVADGYRMTGIDCDVTSVSVAGLRSVLANMNTLPIQSPELSVEGATADKECEIDLADYLPAGLELAGLDNTVVKVTLQVEPLQNRVYTVDQEDIEMTGASDGYSYELQGSEVRITVRGLKEDLDSLSPDKMNLSLDVLGMTPGIHTAVLKYQLDEAYEMIGIPSVTVEVTERTAHSSADTASGTEDEEEQKTQESGQSGTAGADRGTEDRQE